MKIDDKNFELHPETWLIQSIRLKSYLLIRGDNHVLLQMVGCLGGGKSTIEEDYDIDII